MKQFFKFLFASMFGFIIGSVLLFFLFLIIISAAVSSAGKKETVVSNNSVLHLQLDQILKERSSANPLEGFNFSKFESNNQPGLNDILKMIRKAETDDHIKGIYMDLPYINGGIASVEEIRNALLHFRKSGKFVYAFADNYTQGAYYIASAANKIYLNPEGQVALHGLAAELMFFKGTLEKLEIEPQVIRHGKFKSAIEPFILDKMSDENRTQLAGLIDPIWQHMTDEICKSRNITPDDIKHMADSLTIRSAKDALSGKLVDKLAYLDEFSADLNAVAGIGKDEKLNLVTLSAYKHVPEKHEKGSKLSKDKIAVVYAVGSISDGEGSDDEIGSDRLAEAIRDARKDEKVKAIVLRVNSPGGDALASEEIWREVVLAKKAKPVIVSMGDLAASGGYYISCGADMIVAEPNTITGSIGVFGLLFNTGNMLKNKLGITTDTYKTNTYTDMGSGTRALTSSERAILQSEVDRIYDLFTRRVADGRKMQQSAVDSIGQGRVWSGVNAIQIGLVDTLGGIETAIAIAAKKAGITDYRITQLPEQKDPFQVILSDLSGAAKTYVMKEETGDSYVYLKALQSILKREGMQAWSPLDIRFN
ncbi:MAG: signal peptide peptidase SppA [Bacteroidia bacterium]